MNTLYYKGSHLCNHRSHALYAWKGSIKHSSKLFKQANPVQNLRPGCWKAHTAYSQAAE